MSGTQQGMELERNDHLPPLNGHNNFKDYEDVCERFSWEEAEKRLRAYETGQWNATYECIDRHVEEGFGQRVALHYLYGDQEEKWTFADLKLASDRYATLLRKCGVKKGDRVFTLLPQNPSAYIALLGILKTGAIAGPLFEGFMEEAIKERMIDCGAKVLITDTSFLDRIPVQELPQLETILLVDKNKMGDQNIVLDQNVVVQLHFVDDILQEIFGRSDGSHLDQDGSVEREDLAEAYTSQIEWLDKEDGMIIHYTSGSTGKSKGVLHAQRALIQHSQTGEWVLDLQEDDIYWCTAHPGWVTGSAYGLFAPWLNRATIVAYGGRFDVREWYGVIEKAKVSVWYSAPTALRMLMAEGKDILQAYDLSSLRHVLSVGEPLNPEVIHWGVETLGLRIHDTWWMTETGAQLIVNLPSQSIKPGSMGRPLPGIQVGILDDEGHELPRGEIGHLAVRANWPSIMKKIWNNPQKYDSYFPFPGWYVSGDLALQDEEGYVFFQSRSDDVINSAGERIGPFEVESQLIEHPAVVEAAVIGKPDPVRGDIVKAFVVLQEEYADTSELREEIRQFVKRNLAAHAAPREIEAIEELPKTGISGKIKRRVLKAKELEKEK